MKIMIPSIANQQVLIVAKSFWDWRFLWGGCAVAFTAIGLCYAVLLKRDTWVASQGMIVRDEATGAVMRLGRFESQTQMKAAQETILETAQSSVVVQDALNAVGRNSKLFGLWKSDKPYSLSEADSFARDCVKVRAPRGAELGTTEVIYLDVKNSSQERALQIAQALCDSLEKQLQKVRRQRAEGIIRELEAAVAVAQADLEKSTKKMEQIEVNAGADLADLRGLTDANTGSTNRLMLDLVRDDLRKAEIQLQNHRDNQIATQAALDNSNLLLQVTDQLAETQPAIKKLREGLAEATIKTAQLQGKYSNQHPEVLTALNTEEQFRENLRRELSAVQHALVGSIELSEKRMAKLLQQEQELGKRLNRLADIRADYTNVVSEVRARSEELQRTRRELTLATGARDAAGASSLITRLNQPTLGDKPLGPSRKAIIGGAMASGLCLGLGVVFLLVPLDLGSVSKKEVTDEKTSSVSANARPKPVSAKQTPPGMQPSEQFLRDARESSRKEQAEIALASSSSARATSAQAPILGVQSPAQETPEPIAKQLGATIESKQPTRTGESSAAQARQAPKPLIDSTAASASIAKILAAVTDTSIFSDDSPSAVSQVPSAQQGNTTKSTQSANSVPRGLGDIQAIIAEAIKCQSTPSPTSKA